MWCGGTPGGGGASPAGGRAPPPPPPPLSFRLSASESFSFARSLSLSFSLFLSFLSGVQTYTAKLENWALATARQSDHSTRPTRQHLLDGEPRPSAERHPVQSPRLVAPHVPQAWFAFWARLSVFGVVSFTTHTPRCVARGAQRRDSPVETNAIHTAEPPTRTHTQHRPPRRARACACTAHHTSHITHHTSHTHTHPHTHDYDHTQWHQLSSVCWLLATHLYVAAHAVPHDRQRRPPQPHHHPNKRRRPDDVPGEVPIMFVQGTLRRLCLGSASPAPHPTVWVWVWVWVW